METFLIESYAPRTQATADWMRSVAAQLTADPSQIQVRAGVFARDDELCMWVLSAPSHEALVDAAARAGIEGHVQSALAFGAL